MDPFARKMVFATLAFGAAMLLMAGVLSAIYFYNRQCNEAVIHEEDSPGGRWKAAVMERRCGEDSPLYLHVNLRAAGAPIHLALISGRGEDGEIFVAQEETPDTAAALEWTSPAELTIRCPRCSAAKATRREEHWGPVIVRYQLQP